MHKSGFVNIIGNPNVGKSTLMNALVGEKLSIITSKAQTTRHRIMGIVSSEDFQIVYSDTPGILKPSYKLQESMMKFVTGAVADADVILYVTDTVERGERSAEIIDRIAATIYVARDSQKGILIGHKGEKLKRVGQAAREDMEQFLGKKVFLQLFVKVNDDWRNNERQLRRFGYELE